MKTQPKLPPATEQDIKDLWHGNKWDWPTLTDDRHEKTKRAFFQCYVPAATHVAVVTFMEAQNEHGEYEVFSMCNGEKVLLRRANYPWMNLKSA